LEKGHINGQRQLLPKYLEADDSNFRRIQDMHELRRQKELKRLKEDAILINKLKSLDQ